MKITDPTTGRTFYSKRRRRCDEKGPRELTFSCFRRYPLLNDDRMRRWFVEAVEDARKKWPIEVWAYVIMPDHVHLLVNVREDDVKLGRYVGRIKEQVARKALGWIEEHSPQWLPRLTILEGERVRRRFWQPGGGYDRNVLELRTLMSMIDYIHANPVRRGLVMRPEDWEWSSARWYAGIRPVPFVLDRTLPMQYESH